MSNEATAAQSKQYKEVKSILVSQPKPERSPYFKLEEKYGLQIDFRQFIHVEPVSVKEFRKQRLPIEEFTAIIFTSRNAVDHFHRILEGIRVTMPAETKYFCKSEAVANYLQKFITYRKRKVFVGQRRIEDLKPAFMKHKAKEKFLLPCSNLGSKRETAFLNSLDCDWKDSLMYRTVSCDLSDLENVFYDVLVFFSPLGIQSLFENFPNFAQNETRIAVFGNSTKLAAEERDLKINIMAPAPGVNSMTMALENYLKLSND